MTSSLLDGNNKNDGHEMEEAPSTSAAMDPQQEILLQGPPPDYQNLQLRRQSVKVTRERSSSLKGPLRAMRLCVLSVLLPGLLVAVPLYMRFHVYGEQMYPVGMSDMRLLDNRVSTTWCQRQLVRANTTFNAFLLPEQPVVEPEPLRVSMTRHLELEDDMKEYWAFYLLQGSSVTVSTCVRWPGASLVVIRGHKHLHQCAYIGDDSSEELEELEAQMEEERQWPVTSVHDPNRTKITTDQRSENGDTTNEKNKPTRMRRLRPEVTLHGIKNPVSSSEKLLYKEDTDSEDVDNIVIQLLQNIGKAKNKQKAKESADKMSTKPDKESTASTRSDDDTRNSTKDDSAVPTSTEVFEDVLKKLQRLGDNGKGVLRRLTLQLSEATPSRDNETHKVDLSALRNIIREMLHEHSSANRTKSRREIVLTTPSLHHDLNTDDESGDVAEEEDLQPDGIADHHNTVNETTLNDKSKSEFWSSFSSSEERLLNCAGLILNLPLTPHSKCHKFSPAHQHSLAAHENTITYKVPRNGYYFFVFSSENEVQTNYIRVHFDLQKRVYNVSNSMAACTNSTEPCALPLDFFSSEKVVLQLPVRPNESLWNEEFIAVSTCEPRTALYLGCVIAVPLFILLFAFQ